MSKGREPMKKMRPKGMRPGMNPAGVKGMVGSGSTVKNPHSPMGRSQDMYNSKVGSKPSVSVAGVSMKGTK